MPADGLYRKPKLFAKRMAIADPTPVLNINNRFTFFNIVLILKAIPPLCIVCQMKASFSITFRKDKNILNMTLYCHINFDTIEII